MKPRRELPKLSKKRAAEHPELRFSTIARKPLSPADLVPVGQTWLPRSAFPLKQQEARRPKPVPIRKSRIVKKKRTPEQSERIYGDTTKQAWMRSLPCHFCKIEGYTQICHAKTGGMGRKDSAKRTWPGCGPHQVWDCGRFVCMDAGCHNLPHRSKDLLIIAAEYEAKYQAFLQAKAGT